MEQVPRRELLNTALRGLGFVIVGLISGRLLSARKTLAQVQRASPQTLAPADVAKLNSVLTSTTRQNVIQVLQTSDLPDEDRLAVLAVRELSPDAVRGSLEQLQRTAELARRDEGAGDHCGHGCGTDCGRDCGSNCGKNCTFAPAPNTSAAGAFCGGGCQFPAGTLGIVDIRGRVGIDFHRLDLVRFNAAVREAQRLVR